MEPVSSSLEEIKLHRAQLESARIYGGNAEQLNPLESLLAKEAGEENDHSAVAEILLRLLTFATDAMSLPEMASVSRRVQIVIKPGHTIHFDKDATINGLPSPWVEIRSATGQVIQHLEPAYLKAVRGIRSDRKNPSAEVVFIDAANAGCAKRVGTRLISLASIAGVTDLRIATGAGIARALGVTRQAVSLTNKAMDRKIREHTGGKAVARGLRPRADPRQGTKVAKE